MDLDQKQSTIHTDNQDSTQRIHAKNIHEVAVIVVDNFKYIFKSGSMRTKLRTWCCSFEPTCRAMITVNRDGNVIYASNDHCHPALSDQQLRTGPENEVLLFKKLTICSYPDKARRKKNVGKRRENSSSLLESGCGIEGDLHDEESVFPKLGTAFSVVGHEDMMNPVVEGIVGNDDQPLVRNPKSLVIHNFTVTKNTRTMQNILAQALQRLDGGECSDEPVKGPAGSSKWSTGNSKPKEESDLEAAMEEEWQRQFMEQEPDEDDEEDDTEINVEVSEEEEQQPDSDIDEDEMAVILGE